MSAELPTNAGLVLVIQMVFFLNIVVIMLNVVFVLFGWQASRQLGRVWSALSGLGETSRALQADMECVEAGLKNVTKEVVIQTKAFDYLWAFLKNDRTPRR
jgi:hypothetical protein